MSGDQNADANRDLISALGRLPVPILAVDGRGTLRPMNRAGTDLVRDEGLLATMPATPATHPLLGLIASIMSGQSMTSAELQFPSGRSFRCDISRRSERGGGRLLLLVLHPAHDRTEIYDQFDLTDRERQVAELLARGQTSDEICEAMSIGINTLKTHVANLLAKTATRTRAELVARLLER